MKIKAACIIRRLGKWLVCQADKMTAGTERVEIKVDDSKRAAMLAAVEQDCDLTAIREAGRKMRAERKAALALGGGMVTA